MGPANQRVGGNGSWREDATSTTGALSCCQGHSLETGASTEGQAGWRGRLCVLSRNLAPKHADGSLQRT